MRSRISHRGLPIARLAVALLLATLFFSPASQHVAALHTPEEPLPTATGDVDCSRTVNSIDAAVLLHFHTALTASLPCADGADVDGDGVAGSVDAQLILQLEAGLIDSLVRMKLVLSPGSGPCDDPDSPTSCTVPAGSQFGLSIILEGVPAEGYVAFATQLYFGGLPYHPTDSVEAEVTWPDGVLPLRFDGGPSVAHGSLSSLIPPFPTSSYEGQLVELSMSCPSQAETFELALIGYDTDSPVGRGYSPLGSSIVLGHPDHAYGEVVSIITSARADIDLYGYGEPETQVPIAATLLIDCV